MSESLLNRALQFEVSDPWELAGGPDSQRRRAVITAVRPAASEATHDVLLLEVNPEIVYHGTTYREFVATPRYADSLEASLLADGEADASLHGVPSGSAPDNLLSLEWWRGGLGIIATLFLPEN